MKILPERGERALLVGQTGSGKTTLAAWMVQRLEFYPRVILDSKVEPKFEAMPGSRVVYDWKEVPKLAREKDPPRHIILRPSVQITSDPELMDNLLMAHYHDMAGLPIYIDEAYQCHASGRAGPGMLALLTRGRSRGITTIVSTQRPSWLSRFCFTESQRFYVLRIIDRQDRKRIAEVTPYDVDTIPPKHFWGYWDAELDEYQWFRPIDAAPAPYTDDSDKEVQSRWI